MAKKRKESKEGGRSGVDGLKVNEGREGSLEVESLSFQRSRRFAWSREKLIRSRG